MSNKSKFFSDAVAEAKTIRETAFENAKLAMAESFAPQIQNMLSNKLNEMEEDLDENTEEMSLEEILNELEESEVNEAMQEPSDSAAAGAAELERMIRTAVAKTPDLAKKIASFIKGLPAGAGAALRSEVVELEEAMQEPSGAAAAGLDELIRLAKSAAAKAPGIASKLKDFLQGLPAGAGAALRSESTLDEEAEGDDEITTLTVDELKDVIRDVVAELNGGEESDEIVADDEIVDEPIEDEEIDLDEILSEVGGKMQEPSGAAAAGAAELERLIRNAISKSPQLAGKIASFIKGLPAGAGAALRSEVVELEEANKKIQKLTKSLQESNLLNAKLLYVNKLFKAKNLTESQKTNVVNALDRGKTVKETENIFLTLKESLITNPTKPLNENRGSASRPAGVAQQKPTQILNEDVDYVTRMQKLAGIIK